MITLGAMNRMMLPAIALLLTGASLPASVPLDDPLRETVVAAASATSPADLNFERVTKLERKGGGTLTRQTRVERWDGQHWSLVSINDKPPTPAERSQMLRNLNSAGVPGYHSLAAMLNAASGKRIDAEGRTVLLVARLPKGSVLADGKDISSHLKAEAVIGMRRSQPFVEQLRITENEPFKLNMLIKVTSFEQVNNYRLDGDGKPRLVAQANSSAGSMFGFSGGETSEVLYAYR